MLLVDIECSTELYQLIAYSFGGVNHGPRDFQQNTAKPMVSNPHLRFGSRSHSPSLSPFFHPFSFNQSNLHSHTTTNMPSISNSIMISAFIWDISEVIVALITTAEPTQPRPLCPTCLGFRRRQTQYESRSVERCHVRKPHVHELQVGKQCRVLLRRFDRDGECGLQEQSIPVGLERDYVWIGSDGDVQIDEEARQMVREMEREVKKMEREACQIGREMWMASNGGLLCTEVRYPVHSSLSRSVC